MNIHDRYKGRFYIGLRGEEGIVRDPSDIYNTCGKAMKKTALFMVMMIMLGMLLPAIESGQYRLLSHSDSQKWILVSQSIGKPRYILDASTAKITVDGKPAEFKDLDRFAVLNVKFEFKKFKKDGVDIDGVVSEIRILTPEQPTKKQYPILAPKESRH